MDIKTTETIENETTPDGQGQPRWPGHEGWTYRTKPDYQEKVVIFLFNLSPFAHFDITVIREMIEASKRRRIKHLQKGVPQEEKGELAATASAEDSS